MNRNVQSQCQDRGQQVQNLSRFYIDILFGLKKFALYSIASIQRLENAVYGGRGWLLRCLLSKMMRVMAMDITSLYKERIGFIMDV